MSLINSTGYKILIDEDTAILKSYIDQLKPSSIFAIVDQNTKLHCLPYLEDQLKLNFTCIQTPAGESFKNLKTCSLVWNALMQNKCDRSSLVINLGGGVIGDMGGFIASTYMRGIKFIQMPTSLLAQVDASVGSKLGVDFLEYKNMIGLFNKPELVWIKTSFLNTLEERHIKSGLAEIIKHALIHSEEQWTRLKAIDSLGNIVWSDYINDSVEIKNKIVLEDPLEKGLRKILNYGHTIGHAVESYYLNTDKPLLHGEAVALGMICESHLSYQNGMLDANALREINSFIRKFFQFSVKLKSIGDELIERMRLDKKNFKQKIMFSYPAKIGDAVYDQLCNEEQILKSLDYFDNTNN